MSLERNSANPDAKTVDDMYEMRFFICPGVVITAFGSLKRTVLHELRSDVMSVVSE